MAENTGSGTSASKQSFYSFSVKGAGGQPVSLAQYQGKVVLVVNVASKCGYTPQYKGLEEIYRELSGQDFTILGFPCNQFGFQEPGSEAEILSFCKLTYDVTFPIMAKVDVNGDKADPLYSFLKSEAPGVLGTEAIKWNFTKFLIGRNGEVLTRYAPTTEPSAILSDIKKALVT
jgi:glutathione peroxidase